MTAGEPLTAAQRGAAMSWLRMTTEDLERAADNLHDHGEHRAVAMIGDAIASLDVAAWALLKQPLMTHEQRRNVTVSSVEREAKQPGEG